MNLRCFIAIGIPENIQKHIIEVMDFLKKNDSDIKWVKPENIHLTIKFLGNTSQTLLLQIKERLSKVVSYYSPFSIKIYGTGVFPNKRHPRVIWIGTKDSKVLAGLRNDIEHSMSYLGYQQDDKEYNPHLTLGRIRSQKGIVHVMNNMENFKDEDFGTINVDSIRLMKSELMPRGAEYTCLYEIPLIRREDDK